MTTTNERVFMIASGSLKNGIPETTSFVRSQAESIRERGWEVFVSVVDDRTSMKGIRRNLRRLRHELREAQPSLIHAQYGSVTAALARITKGQLPLLISFCGDDLLGTPIPGMAWRFREKGAWAIGIWAARGADAIVVKSRNLLQALPRSLRAKATILPNGVNSSWFTPLDKEVCRGKLGWSQESKIVLFNASSNEDQYRKNPALARDTIKIVARSFPDVSLQMISNASPEEVRLSMNAADCLLVTSLQEGSPNIVKEAMSCNLPVVSVSCGDVAERLATTFPGAVRTYNAGELAESVVEVLGTNSRSNGRSQIEMQGLDTVRIAERLIQIYKGLQKQHLPVAGEPASTRLAQTSRPT